MSLDTFLSRYPSGKIPRQSPDYGKTFVCRRACNTRTATYSDEFVWEETFQGVENLHSLIDLVKTSTKATRQRRRAKSQSPPDGAYLPPQTPTKAGRSAATTPQSRRTQATPGSRTTKKSVFPSCSPYE